MSDGYSEHHLGVIDDNGGSSSPSSSRVHTPRPGLSRTSSVSSMALAEADDTFSGLTLLDLLVALDAHVDLAHRELKKKGQQLKNKAESTAIQVKRSAGKTLRRRVTGRTSGAHSGDNARESDIDELAPEEVFDRELQKFRHKLQARLNTVKAKWKDQRVVSLRDKLSFFFGVELVLFSALLIGFRPQWIPGVYTALAAYLFPIRIYEYRKKSYSLFLYDLCYIVNVMTLAYLWLFPSSSKLLIACYCLSHGPLCTAIATWRNSLVFHSVDKVTSLFIHVYPPFVFTVLRHFYPNAGEKYPALNSLDTLNVWKSLTFSSIAYLVWQIFYYYFIIVARKEEIEKQGRITSFTYMLNNKKSLIGKTLAKIKPQHREPFFMAGQFVYTIVTMAPSAIWLLDSKYLSVLWIWVFFSVSVWNGASFYFKIMSNSKEVASLKKELEALQKEIDGSKTPASQASIPSSEPLEEVSLGPSATSASSSSAISTAIEDSSFASVSDAAGASVTRTQDEGQIKDLTSINNKKLDAASAVPVTDSEKSEISSTISTLSSEATTSPSTETGTPSNNDDDEDEGVESFSFSEQVDRNQQSNIPLLKLDDSESSSNDAASDTSAVVVDAKDGVPL